MIKVINLRITTKRGLQNHYRSILARLNEEIDTMREAPTLPTKRKKKHPVNDLWERGYQAGLAGVPLRMMGIFMKLILHA